jgi:cytochrome P450
VTVRDERAFVEDFDHHNPGFVNDPAPVYLELHARCPVVRTERYGGFWFLSRYDDVRSASKDWEAFTSAVPNVTAIPSSHPRQDPDLPVEIDPPLHTRYRQLVAPVFTRRRVHAMKPELRAIASGLLDRLLAARGGDLVSGFAVPLSVGTLALFTGLPDEDRSRWVGWVRRMYDANDYDASDRADTEEATAEYYAYIDALIASRRPDLGGDFISMLLASEVESERLSPRDVARFMRVLLIAGHETTASAMSFTLHWLAEHPEERRRLSDDSALIPTAVEEFLRLSSPIVLSARNAVHDVELHGVRISEGDIVALGWAAANLDAAAFAEPTRCLLDRAPNRHGTFGFGPHLCVGAHVARLELTVMLEQLGERVNELRVVGEVRPNRNGSVRSLASLPVEIG